MKKHNEDFVLFLRFRVETLTFKDVREQHKDLSNWGYPKDSFESDYSSDYEFLDNDEAYDWFVKEYGEPEIDDLHGGHIVINSEKERISYHANEIRSMGYEVTYTKSKHGDKFFDVKGEDLPF